MIWNLFSSAELRDEHLSALQRDHELRSQFEARQIRKEAAEEEARRQEIAAREERERQAKAKIQLAKEKAEAEAAKRKAQADAAAAAALKREEDQKAKENLQQSAKEKDAHKKNADQKESTSKATTGLSMTFFRFSLRCGSIHLFLFSSVLYYLLIELVLLQDWSRKWHLLQPN